VNAVPLTATHCAICGTEGNAETVYPANFGADAFTPAVFSARRLPDRIHYRLVRCLRCGLLRSDPVASTDVISGLYSRSEFNYGEEVGNLSRTYGRYLAALERYGRGKQALLEVGCGNGFVLEEALRQGYAAVRGVEPSADAVAQALPHVRDGIVVDFMRPGLFDEESFDVICLFQVLDHLPDPAGVLAECLRLLKPGGLVLCLNHDVGAVSARVLGERSPIVDIEHTYLFSRKTAAKLFEAQDFRVLASRPARNTYSLDYLAHLVPLPARVKTTTQSALRATRLASLRLSVRLGNLYVVAERPRELAA
jgi:SAM-dependent methyltransferase